MASRQTHESAKSLRETGDDSERTTMPASSVDATLTISDKALKELDRIPEKAIWVGPATQNCGHRKRSRLEQGVMGASRHTCPTAGLLAVACVLVGGIPPAAAQFGSGTVVCVGSETRTHQAKPIRRVYTEDMEVVYRTGVDLGQRDQMEGALRSELGSYPEVWCAWSGPGDDHAVVVSYTGVLRQDLTVDPEDPRFQAFSVGFGQDFNEAETEATRISQRFSTYYDGSGYEVLLRERWSGGSGAASEGGQRGLPRSSEAASVEPVPPPQRARAEPQAGETREFAGMEFVWVPPGEFVMGSDSEHALSLEQPLTRVRISRGYWLGRHEVTQGRWRAVMGNNPSRFDECGSDCPVEQVSWEDAQAFMQALNAREQGLGVQYRLPTEAEWEYAARAGTRGDTYAGNVTDPWGLDPVLERIAWCDENSGGRTQPVGQKAPNAWGLHDMLGNVQEWVQDWYGGYPGGSVTDPAGPGIGSYRTIRGGSWFLYGALYCRSSSRYFGVGPGDRHDDLGFRLLRTQ